MLNNMSSEITNSISIIHQKISDYKKAKKKIFVSSSFQTHSIPLLHIIATIDNTIPIYFLNTGFHFPETLIYKNQIQQEFHLNVIDLFSQIPKSQQLNSSGNFFFCSNTDFCCEMNKTAPLEPILAEMDIWITGVRREQNMNRQNMQIEQKSKFNTLRFHPMLEWTTRMIGEYRKVFNLPAHPLEKQGYLSIGCEPCTSKYIEDERQGRWAGSKKTECGLHTSLIKK